MFQCPGRDPREIRRPCDAPPGTLNTYDSLWRDDDVSQRVGASAATWRGVPTAGARQLTAASAFSSAPANGTVQQHARGLGKGSAPPEANCTLLFRDANYDDWAKPSALVRILRRSSWGPAWMEKKTKKRDRTGPRQPSRPASTIAHLHSFRHPSDLKI